MSKLTHPETPVFSEQQFLQLSAGSQQLLELIAIAYAPLSSTQLARLLPDSPPVATLRPVLKELEDAGWITSNALSQFSCATAVCDELTLRSLHSGSFPGLAKAAREVLCPKKNQNSWAYKPWLNVDEALRDLRLNALLGDMERLEEQLMLAQRQFHGNPKFRPSPWISLWGTAIDERWLAFFSDPVFLQLIGPFYLALGEQTLVDAHPVWTRYRAYLLAADPKMPDVWEWLGSLLFWELLLRNDQEEALCGQPADLNSVRYQYWCLFSASRALLQGRPSDAIALHKTGLKLLRKLTRSRKALFHSPFELFFVLALLLENSEQSFKEIAIYFKENAALGSPFEALAHFADLRKSGKALPLRDKPEYYNRSAIGFLLALIVRHWIGQPIPRDWQESAILNQQQAEACGYHWMALEYAAALVHLLPDKHPQQAHFAERVAHYQADTQQADTLRLIHLYQPAPAWAMALEALQRLGGSATPAAKASPPAGAERLVWTLSRFKYQKTVTYSIAPKLQKSTKKGWTDGRNVALKRLAQEAESFPFLSSEDRRLCQAIKLYSYSYYEKAYELDIQDAWPHLIGHPRIFWDSALSTPLDIQTGREELLILKERGKLRIKLFPDLPDLSEYKPDQYWVTEETATQLKLYKLSASLLQLQQILGKDGLLVPPEAEASVRQTLEALAPLITIQSDISGTGGNAETIEADTRLHVHLLPWAEGLRLLLRVLPLGDAGPVFPPGSGRENVMAEVNGKLLKTARPLKQERKLAQQLLRDCPALAHWEDITEDLLLEEPEACLEALQNLQAWGEQVVLTWPEGEKLRITPQISAGNLSLKIKQSGDWFELDGKLQVNSQLVLTLRELLDISRHHTGRFVALENGQFLTLTRQFQKKLDALRTYTEAGKKGLKLGVLAGMTLEDLFAEAGELEADKHWKAQLKQLKQARDSQPAIPAGLQAELRDYQADGFRWMARLAEWGVGACLADDMGLGKTVQTLALLLTRGSKGPALVVAPVSVCNNWFSECQRFAPALRPVYYRGKERQELLDSLQPNDVLIVSYGLLQQDIGSFQPLRWSSIVLDEAQAIKNTATKRTQAAYQLQGDFRLVTTGTPIENHLGELWSLFRFLNPGLLFSQQQFMTRFMTPIERDQDDMARQHLKKLVQPFMLRRTKNQVLQELPPRTEITLSVSLSEGESALYEAIRQQALERLAQPVEAGENKHLDVLAEITRLRLAACHPQLAMPGSALPSSKLQALIELITELRENQHKALIFSQFVKHLDLIRAWLDAEGVRYQYLDGSTSMEQRKERVDAFQRGEGDVFLISLKAGGFGLNLTAADYVIHMDPWWNPAVEDQASDRAHRIGQLRPVTVYRLVAENTIEERIVKLHQSKRDLADSLLEGSDISGKLSAKDMLNMIRDEP